MVFMNTFPRFCHNFRFSQDEMLLHFDFFEKTLIRILRFGSLRSQVCKMRHFRRFFNTVGICKSHFQSMAIFTHFMVVVLFLSSLRLLLRSSLVFVLAVFCSSRFYGQTLVKDGVFFLLTSNQWSSDNQLKGVIQASSGSVQSLNVIMS